MVMSQILVIDDEPAICFSVRERLTERGHRVETVGSVEQAWERLPRFQPDAVLLDVRLPGEDGLTALPEFRRRCPDVPVIVMTAFGDLPTAVTALGRGAYDYLVKPFDLDRLAELVDRAVTPRTVAPALSPAASDDTPLVGRSPAMQGVFRQIALIAPTDFPVLVVGETGTGKDVAARAIHEHSPRHGEPFVPICPAALNPAVIESELFGHVRGAFTGATEHRAGLFELADNGTIFLDEIAETPLSVQVKLLRVLETRKFCPVGSGVERTTNARLIAATHRNLPEMIAAGTFREDLYHRLKVFTVSLPPLRDRRDDLRPLVEHFLGQQPVALQPAGIAADFWDEIARRDWRGNVRELRNACDHAVVLARQGELRAEHLPPVETAALSGGATPADQVTAAVVAWTRAQLESGESAEPLHARLLPLVESALFREVLQATQQNRTAAAQRLGLDRATLRSRLKQLFGDDDRQGSAV
jgi:DNA-binding NtrC family response regulator